MKPFIVLFGNTYYPNGWDDYVGEADTVEEASAIADRRDEQEGGTSYTWWEIIDLRVKQCVLTRKDEDPPFDPRSS